MTVNLYDYGRKHLDSRCKNTLRGARYEVMDAMAALVKTSEKFPSAWSDEEMRARYSKNLARLIEALYEDATHRLTSSVALMQIYLDEPIDTEYDQQAVEDMLWYIFGDGNTLSKRLGNGASITHYQQAFVSVRSIARLLGTNMLAVLEDARQPRLALRAKPGHEK